MTENLGSTIFEKKTSCVLTENQFASRVYFSVHNFSLANFDRILSVVFLDRKYIKEDIVLGRIDIRLVQIAKHFHFKIRKNPLTYNTVFSMEPT